ncbi:hypothetical protein [uncultured Tenacibaculum sp.]|uniref:hypothetical protein n=1 Tax=uncultured Tenacibaculum sp. TaxID=174713 RepID=UPI0026017851|nr:hypothetical protein [uncultured Tenacibaculum sp.]
MKKSILNLGQVLNKAQQKQVNGGRKYCESHEDCGTGCCNTARFCQVFGAPNTGGLLCDGSLFG